MFSVVAGVRLFVGRFKHLLIILLGLEFVVLGLFSIFMLIFSSHVYYFSLVVLVFTVCEGALGLGMVVRVGRVFGGDFFYIINYS